MDSYYLDLGVIEIVYVRKMKVQKSKPLKPSWDTELTSVNQAEFVESKVLERLGEGGRGWYPRLVSMALFKAVASQFNLKEDELNDPLVEQLIESHVDLWVQSAITDLFPGR